MPEKPDKKNERLRNTGKYLGLSSQMLIILFIGVFGGIKLDELLKWEFPVFTVVLSVLALILAIYSAIKDFL